MPLLYIIENLSLSSAQLRDPQQRTEQRRSLTLLRTDVLPFIRLAGVHDPLCNIKTTAEKDEEPAKRTKLWKHKSVSAVR